LRQRLQARPEPLQPPGCFPAWWSLLVTLAGGIGLLAWLASGRGVKAWPGNAWRVASRRLAQGIERGRSEGRTAGGKAVDSPLGAGLQPPQAEL